MARCNICGGGLRGGELARCLFRRKDVVYPVRRGDGTRSEQALRWICSACIRRGLRYRIAAELDRDLDASLKQPSPELAEVS